MSVLFAVQAGVSVTSLAFAMYMLSSDRDPGIYLPIITGVVASWLPAPQIPSFRSAAFVAPAPRPSPPNDIETPPLLPNRDGL